MIQHNGKINLVLKRAVLQLYCSLYRKVNRLLLSPHEIYRRCIIFRKLLYKSVPGNEEVVSWFFKITNENKTA